MLFSLVLMGGLMCVVRIVLCAARVSCQCCMCVLHVGVV